MFTHRTIVRFGACAIAAAMTAVLLLNSPTLQAQAPAPADATDGIEVLARGPIHEAFAEPVVFDPVSGAVVDKVPPPPIEELPTEQTLVGDNVAWVPGYWGWDFDRKDFLWVSGFWRTIPPGRQWVPGYWSKVAGGSQWISGFWAPADGEELEYLSVPPQSLEQGPSTPAPTENHFWVSGCWYWRDARYLWRPGYWTVAQVGWMWIPAHYVWTPQGCVFVSGYWDHDLPDRGLLFAPVYFQRPIYLEPNYYFTPRLGVDIALLTDHFFIGASFNHYYYGDYYQASYFDSGIQPWFAFHGRHHGYDPIYVHHRHARRHDRDWDQRLHRNYEHRRDHDDARPSRLVAALNARDDHNHDTDKASRDTHKASMVKSVEQLSANPDSKIHLQKLDMPHRDELAKRAKATSQIGEQRRSHEKHANTDGSEAKSKPVVDGQPARVPLPKSPVAARSTGRGKSAAKEGAKLNTDSVSTKELTPPQNVPAKVDKPSGDKRPKVVTGEKTNPPQVSQPTTLNGQEAPVETSPQAPKPETVRPAKPDAGPAPQPNNPSAPKPETVRPAKPDAGPAPQPNDPSAPKPESVRPAKPDAGPAPQPNDPSAPKPEAVRPAKPDAGPAPKPNNPSAPKPEAVRPAKPDAGPAPQPNNPSAPKPEAVRPAKPDAGPAPKPNNPPPPRTEAVRPAKPDAGPAPKPNNPPPPRTEAVRPAKPDAGPAPRPNNPPPPKVEARPAPRPNNPPPPKVEARPAPRPNNPPPPKMEARPAPKPNNPPPPKMEARPAPRADSNSRPRQETARPPRSEGKGSEGKGKNK